QVAEAGRAFERRLEAHRIWPAARLGRGHLLGGPVALGTAVAERFDPARGRIGAHLLQLLLGHERLISLAAGEQLIDILLVDPQRVALGLDIWAVRATDVGTLIPVDAHPAQRLHHIL